MDVCNSGIRPNSILNDNDSPSFAVRPRHPQPTPSEPSPSEHVRPSLCRLGHYSKRPSSSSSLGSPPLLRFDSTSSKSSSGSMDSSPSPITSMYNYGDANLTGYDNLLRPEMTTYMPSP